MPLLLTHRFIASACLPACCALAFALMLALAASSPAVARYEVGTPSAPDDMLRIRGDAPVEAASAGVAQNRAPDAGGAAAAHDDAPRPFYRVALQDAEDAIAQALEKAGISEHVRVIIIGNRAPVLYQADSPLALEVKTLRWDDRAGKWTANLLVHSGGKVATALPVTGRYEEMVKLPVLRQRVLPSDVIAAELIDWQLFPKHRARDSVLIDPQEMVGKSPKRGVSAGRPVRAEELVGASALAKGATVTLRYQSGRVDLRTLGEALEAGKIGDTIRVRNSDSKKIVRGVVENAREVRVVASDSEILATPPLREAVAPVAAPADEGDGALFRSDSMQTPVLEPQPELAAPSPSAPSPPAPLPSGKPAPRATMPESVTKTAPFAPSPNMTGEAHDITR